MKFLGKRVELENIILRGNPITKQHTHGMYSRIKWILAQKLGIPKTQFIYQMMSKKKEGEAPGPGKARCSSVEKYQDRKAGGS